MSTTHIQESKLRSQANEYERKIETSKKIIQHHKEERENIKKIIDFVKNGGIDKQRAEIEYIRTACGVSEDKSIPTPKAIAKKAKEEYAKSLQIQQEVDSLKAKLTKYQKQAQKIKNVLIKISMEDLISSVKGLRFDVIKNPLEGFITRVKGVQLYKDEIEKKKQETKELYSRIVPPKRVLSRETFKSEPVNVKPNDEYNGVKDVMKFNFQKRLENQHELFQKHKDFIKTFNPQIDSKDFVLLHKRADNADNKKTDEIKKLQKDAAEAEQNASLQKKQIDEKAKLLLQKQNELKQLEEEYDHYQNMEKEIRETPPEKLSNLYLIQLQRQKKMREDFEQKIMRTKVKAQTTSKLKQNRINQLCKSLGKETQQIPLHIPKYYPSIITH